MDIPRGPIPLRRHLLFLTGLAALFAPAALGFGAATPLRAFVPAPQAQKPEQSRGIISGVVIDGSSGEAVPDAVVFLASTPARPLGAQTRQLTDERGRFAFVNLPGDVSYSMSATKLGYLDGGYGRDTMPNEPLRSIPLRADEWIPNIKVSIWKPGAISGMVRDESGEPVVGVVVRALQRVRIQGREDFIGGSPTRTDDRGAYRLSNLSPGRYVLQVPSVQAAVPVSASLVAAPDGPGRGGFMKEVIDAMDIDETQRLVIGRYPVPPPPQNGRHMSYPVIFYPSTPSASDATAIELKFGEDRQRVDLVLTPVTSVRVSGTVEGPPASLRALTLRLLPAGLENLGFGAEVATALVAGDGGFTFLNVPAGTYTIDAPIRISELSSVPAQIGSARLLPGPPTTPVAGATGSVIDLIPGIRLTNYNYRFADAPYSARASITIGSADVTGVVVRMRPHIAISGRVVVETDPSRPEITAPPRFTFQLDPAGGEASLTASGGGRGGAAGPDQFQIQGVIPGQYWLRVSSPPPAPPAWLVKSVTWGDRDYTFVPLDAGAADAITGVVVTVTNALPELTGSVRDAENLKADATMVIAFPADQAQWKNTGLWPARVKSAIVTSTRTFQFTTLPAGDYLVAAVSRSFAETWRDPAFLSKAAASASRVTLTWAGKSSVDVAPVVIR